MKVAIFHNSQKNNADTCALQVADILYSLGVEVFADFDRKDFYSSKGYMKFDDFSTIAKNSDVAIAIGGDGTILQCAKHIIGSDTKLLGINTGHLGFMASVEVLQLDELKRLITNEYTVIPRMMLKVSTSDGKSFEALNDVSIVREYSKIFDFSVKLNDFSMGNYRADGIIFSTPTGSTAYSLSAGGSIIEPDVQCIEMVLVSPHLLGVRPMIFSPEKRLTFSHSCTEDDIFFSVDGNPPIRIGSNVEMTVEKSKNTINIIDMMSNTFYKKLNKIRL
ncbi:MAG: NAD(+)/NADH kinase [Oscillospiraceae bacterium]